MFFSTSIATRSTDDSSSPLLRFLQSPQPDPSNPLWIKINFHCDPEDAAIDLLWHHYDEGMICWNGYDWESWQVDDVVYSSVSVDSTGVEAKIQWHSGMNCDGKAHSDALTVPRFETVEVDLVFRDATQRRAWECPSLTYTVHA